MQNKGKSGIFYFSPIDYDYLTQRPQQLYNKWKETRAGPYAFFYVEPPVFVNFNYVKDHFALLPRQLTRRYTSHNSAGDPNRIVGRICLSSELFGVPIFERLNKRTMHRVLESTVKRFDRTAAIVASALWEPFIPLDEFDLVCYDYLDPIGVLFKSPYSSKARLLQQHKKLVERSDVIFVTAEALKEDAIALAHDKEIIMIPNGVDYDFFENNKTSYDVSGYPRTNRRRVGYVGSFHWVDFDLVAAVARELPEVDFLFIGPFNEQLRCFLDVKRSNVFALGRKEFTQIPSYINALEVGLIPFEKAVADAVDPVKLYEYFSLGKPVVATRLRQLQKYDDGSLLRTAEKEQEFVEGIRFFLDNDSETCQASRRQIARQNSWLSRATIMIDSIESALSSKCKK